MPLFRRPFERPWLTLSFPPLSRPALYSILLQFLQCVKRFSAFWLLAFPVLFNYPYRFLLLVVVVGNVELWNCLCIPLFSLCLCLLFMWITMWITCGYAVDNFWSGSSSVFFSRVSAVKTEEQKTCFLWRLLMARLLVSYAVGAVEQSCCSAVNWDVALSFEW